MQEVLVGSGAMSLRSTALALVLPAALLVPIAAFGDGEPGTPAKKKPLPAVSPDQKYDPENITGISEFMEQVSKGNEKYVAKDMTGAIDTYKKAIQLAPKNALGPYLLAEAYLANGNLPEAESAIATAVEIAPAEQKQSAFALKARVLFLRADIYEREKKYSDARTAWQLYVDTANKVNADGGAYPNSGTERIKALQRVIDMEKPYAAVRERIAADKADAGKSAPAKKK